MEIKEIESLRDFVNEYKAPIHSVEIPSNFSAFSKRKSKFESILSSINLIGLKFQFEEIGTSYDGDIEAIFYIGERPSNLIEKLKKTYDLGEKW